MNEEITMWVFNGSGNYLPGGLFLSREEAEKWIRRDSLSGLLTRYPVNKSLYDWAIDQGFFRPNKKEHTSSKFIENFTSAHLEHYHYVDGQCRT